MKEKCDNCPCLTAVCIGEQEPCRVSREELREQIISTLKVLYEMDKQLIEVRANEVCISAHFWFYFKQNFQSLYKNMNIDPEYNRNGIGPKSYYIHTGENSQQAKPDMIIHKRGCNKHNFAYFEFKTNRGDFDNDYKKLKAFTEQELVIDKKYIYRYQYGVSIYLTKEKIKIRWFEKGQKVDEEEYCPVTWDKCF